MDAATAIQEESENDIFFIFISMQMAVLPVRPFSRHQRALGRNGCPTDSISVVSRAAFQIDRSFLMDQTIHTICVFLRLRLFQKFHF
jgi:hypothetical protein